MLKTCKELDLDNTYSIMQKNIETLMSFQEVTRLSYIDRNLAADNAVQGENNLTSDATQLRKITDDLLETGSRLEKRLTRDKRSFDILKQMLDS